MKKSVLLLFFIFITPFVFYGQARPHIFSSVDIQKIAEKVATKFAEDLDFVNKNFTHREEETNQIFDYKTGKYLRTEHKLYESLYKSGKTYRKRLDKKEKAQAVKYQIKFDAIFFERFQFEFVESKTENGRIYIVLKFRPKPGIGTQKKFNQESYDKVANQVEGEIHVYPDDLRIKYFIARLVLVDDEPIKFALGGFQLEKLILNPEIEYVNGRARIKTLMMEYKYWVLIRPNKHSIQVIEFKDYQEVNKPAFRPKPTQ